MFIQNVVQRAPHQLIVYFSGANRNETRYKIILLCTERGRDRFLWRRVPPNVVNDIPKCPIFIFILNFIFIWQSFPSFLCTVYIICYSAIVFFYLDLFILKRIVMGFFFKWTDDYLKGKRARLKLAARAARPSCDSVNCQVILLVYCVTPPRITRGRPPRVQFQLPSRCFCTLNTNFVLLKMRHSLRKIRFLIEAKPERKPGRYIFF